MVGGLEQKKKRLAAERLKSAIAHSKVEVVIGHTLAVGGCRTISSRMDQKRANRPTLSRHITGTGRLYFRRSNKAQNVLVVDIERVVPYTIYRY